MRKLAPLALVAALACSTATPPDHMTAPSAAETAYGMTVAEEAQILALEDRREFDPSVVAAWVAHPNALHRRRIALALGRIGPHNFVDRNNDKAYTPDYETRAGVAELATLAADSDRSVREAAAFALGEIGDPAATETLFKLAGDSDGAVAAESVEALSKLSPDREWAEKYRDRYLWLAGESWPEGVRARTIRYLFRFDDDAASEAAASALGSPVSILRQEGAYALSRRAYAKAAPQLELVLNDPNPLTRAYAAAALGRIALASSAPKLVDSLGDMHPWVRTNAAVSLARIADKDASVIRSEDLPRVFAAAEDPDPGVRSSTVHLLGYYAIANETARVRLLEIARSGTQWERDLAAIAFLEHLDEQARNSLINDNVPQSPERVTERKTKMFKDLTASVSAWGRARAIEAVLQTYRGVYASLSDPDPSIRAAILGAMDPSDAASIPGRVKEKLTDPDVIVRANAIEKYAKGVGEPPETKVQSLREAEQRERTSEMNDARLAAITSLAAIDFPDRRAFLQSLLSDSDPVVRRIASEQIAQQLHLPQPGYTPLPVRHTAAEYEEIVRWSREPHTATIHMTRGKIELALLTQDAPVTTWNFAQLAKKKFFDNTSFMRVVPNFVIQGGDPRNDMNGGPGYAIRDEINLQKYTRGAVGMALSGPDTGGSQFFITHSPQPHLDGGYTVFGRVYEGMSAVVDQTERGDRVETISIDEHAPAAAETISAIPNVSLPLVVGPMTPDRLTASVPGYAEGIRSYQPDVTVVEMMKNYVQPGDRVEVYMGTWCDDSQREVPKFLRISEELKSQFGVNLPASFIAVDRSKQQPAALIAGKSLTKVATFIYYRGDRELGRIEERPQGLFEDDLLALAAKDAR